MIRCHQLLWLTATAALCRAMPTGCTEDTHCPSGFYCDQARLFCSQCLSCQLLNRSSASGTACVTKVEECGPCFKGLVPVAEDWSCSDPGLGLAGGTGLPPVAWAAIALGLLGLSLLVTAAAVLALRNFHSFKILACSTRTSVHTPQEPPPPVDTTAPPPYHAVVGTPTAPSDPIALEEARPFILPVTPRESAGRQGARVFSPPDYQEPGCQDEGAPLALQGLSAPADHSSVDGMVPEVASGSEMEPPLAKPQDGNNNSGERTRDRQAGSPGPSFIAQPTSAVIINVIKNINANHPPNDATLHDY